MLVSAISYLLKRSYNGYKVYIHNLSHFDGIFLFRILSNYKNCTFTPVMKDGKMITLKLSWKPSDLSLKFYSIEFKDSYLMLPISLKNLAKAFNVQNKGLFPYNFVNNVDLNYAGKVPAFSYFENISNEDYNIYKSNYNIWNLRNESIKYCELDCKVLWNVINIFNKLIFDKYQLNIHRFPTLPSLAFAIFRCHYLIENQVPKISGQMFHDIRKGYTGGHTDVYKPLPIQQSSLISLVFSNILNKTLNLFRKVYRYDVNSLYPYVMSEFPMPVGKITYFEGNVLDFMDNTFGFFEVEVTTPKFMIRPLLQTKVQTKGGLRTVAPLGQWTDMVFSEEMKEYMKYGYKFKVLRGYLFDKGLIFEEYVKDLYKIKQSETSGSPMYLISKLLLNSLYGRFGMDYNTLISKHEIVYNILSYQILDKNIITDIIKLDDEQILVSYYPKDIDDTLNLEYFDNQKFKISISIASAVTAYARIHMSPILADPNLKLLYTDTDSAFIEGELDPSLIGKELGKFKLEYKFKECVFLAPKVYGGILDNGKELTNVKGLLINKYKLLTLL